MKRSLVRRSKWHLLLGGVGALAFAAAALGASVHGTAAPTLVIDNSFTLKTADPQRAFDPTGSIVAQGWTPELQKLVGGKQDAAGLLKAVQAEYQKELSR